MQCVDSVAVSGLRVGCFLLGYTVGREMLTTLHAATSPHAFAIEYIIITSCSTCTQPRLACASIATDISMLSMAGKHAHSAVYYVKQLSLSRRT